MSSPEQIQRNIEQTRENLRTDVDRFAEKVSPTAVVGRRVDRVKSGASSLRERVMGAVPDGGQVTGAVKDTASSVTDGASSLGAAAAGAPQAVRRQAQGSPLAAGVVAFGIGMVLAGLAPATEREQQLVESAEEKVRQPVQEKASEIVEELKEPAQQAVQQVKDTAAHAASQTADDAKSAAQDVQQPFQS